MLPTSPGGPAGSQLSDDTNSSTRGGNRACWAEWRESKLERGDRATCGSGCCCIGGGPPFGGPPNPGGGPPIPGGPPGGGAKPLIILRFHFLVDTLRYLNQAGFR